MHGLSCPGQGVKGASHTGICVASVSVRTAFFLVCHFMVIMWTLELRTSLFIQDTRGRAKRKRLVSTDFL